MTESFIKLFDRDLRKLAEEIRSYKDEKKIWQIQGEIKNSAGNLCTHLIGNLNHFIGTILGGTGYVRNRDEEFSVKDISAGQLVNDIEQVNETVTATLKKLTDDDLKNEFPAEVRGGPMTTQHFLLHLYGHMNYHLGQVNYHRRLIDID